MRLEFKHIVLHNFLSYGHSEISLDNRGYCLVSGINKCPKDNAVSNGSGKSSWVSAICWCLTGETIQGITKDIKNIYVDEDLCFVTITFKCDNDLYEITRYNKPKSDLKIIVNGVDKSGKGIRESELVLANYLPDLSKNLISSVILLGQGLPNKLSSHTPSGRKEMLEQLSKSDFMIEDIKNRIGARLLSLNNMVKDNSDKLIQQNTLLNMYMPQLEKLEKEKTECISPDYKREIAQLNDVIATSRDNLNKSKDCLEKMNLQLDELSQKLLTESNRKQSDLNNELLQYNAKKDVLNETKTQLQTQLQSLRDEIIRMKSIKNVCPTCGQKIPGVVKPDTSVQELKVESLTEELNKTQEQLNSIYNMHCQYVSEINKDYESLLNNINVDINTTKAHVRTFQSDVYKYQEEMSQGELKLTKTIADRDGFDKYWEDLKNKIESLKKDIETTKQLITQLNDVNASLQSHLDVVKKMDTLVKRDFRGYLLSSVIEFINRKAKEYCVEVFGSNELEFYLDGNNIDISYCNKPFESLSGGEKQKVDLVLQFAIRDMMSQHLDFSSNILCLDEIFDNLDAISTKNVLNLISNKLSDIESLFIISHHSDELSIPYDTTLIITKSEYGISEVK